MVEQPALADQTGDTGWVGAKRIKRGEDFGFQVSHFGEQAIADRVLDDVAEPLDWIEFRTVGRQRQEPDIGWDAGLMRSRVEAGLVPNDDVPGGRIAVRNLGQEQARTGDCSSKALKS